MKNNSLLCYETAMIAALATTNICGAANQPVEMLSKKDNSKPNIIFILCDDMGYGDLACYGQKYINPHCS